MTDLLAPPSVAYEITVIWPSGERSQYSGIDLDLPQAADRLETLVEELREAIPVETETRPA